MDAAFENVAFAEPDRAQANLQMARRRLPASLWSRLPTLLAQVPDPDGALNYLERFLRPDADGSRSSASVDRAIRYLVQNPTALHYLLVIFSYSRFLSETLIQQPELARWLHRGGRGEARSLEQTQSREHLEEELARFQTIALDVPPSVVLARFKRREYLRIVLRDVLGLATLAEVTLELSQLADVLLEHALAMAEERLGKQYGSPQFTDSTGRTQAARLAILSLGKLGGQELNYSSDIDLMFLYSHDGETSGGSAGRISNAEYFVRLAQAVLKLITEPTPEGAVFRIDLRLRPQGGEGDLAVALAPALDYYRSRAREWELQMLIKARGSAGDSTLAREFLRGVHPHIYRASPEGLTRENLAALEAVLNARQEITRALRSRSSGRRQTRPGRASPFDAAEWNVKLSPGGIRDIEFLAQCLQRLYGGGDPWLAAPATASTLVALQRLHDKGLLSGRDLFRLGSAYQFLRRIEHRLQLRDGLQRHTLPEAPDALDRLARRCGIEAPLATSGRRPRELLRERIRRHFDDVREVYERTLVSRARALPRDSEVPAVEPAGEAPASPQAEPDARPASYSSLLKISGLPAALRRSVAQAAVEAGPYARRGLQRFLESAVLSPEALNELDAHPEWLRRAAEIFARSDLAVEILARHPAEIAVVADPGLAGFRGPLLAAGPFDEAMSALRIAYRRSVLATVVRAILASAVAGTGDPASRAFDDFALFTRLAEEVLTGAMHLACAESPAADPGEAPLAVIALGRLGTYEMDIGSDADVVFVIDESLRPEQAEPWRRLAERFVHVVSSHTRDGLLFPVDTRLRPHGGAGEMLQSVNSLRDYFCGEAQGLEAATWLKARTVAGNLDLGARAIAAVHQALRHRYSTTDGARELARQLAHTRERLETESTGPRAKGRLKRASGGYYDIDYVVAYLFLTRGLDPEPANILQQIAFLERERALDTDGASKLSEAARLFRSLDHAHRLVTGRPASRLPEPALAERLEALLRQWGLELEAGLRAEVEAARRATRSLYEQTLLAGVESG